MEYLGIEFEADTLASFTEVRLKGRLGDPTGVKQYSGLSAEPTEKWKKTIGNPIRREWSRRYLRFLGNDRLSVMGYDGEQLIRELKSSPASATSLVPDIGWLISDFLREPLRAGLRRYGIGGPARWGNYFGLPAEPYLFRADSADEVCEVRGSLDDVTEMQST